MWCDPARRAAWQLQYDRERKRPDYVPRFVARRMKKLAGAARRVVIEKKQTAHANGDSRLVEGQHVINPATNLRDCPRTDAAQTRIAATGL